MLRQLRCLQTPFLSDPIDARDVWPVRYNLARCKHLSGNYCRTDALIPTLTGLPPFHKLWSLINWPRSRYTHRRQTCVDRTSDRQPFRSKFTTDLNKNDWILAQVTPTQQKIMNPKNTVRKWPSSNIPFSRSVPRWCPAVFFSYSTNSEKIHPFFFHASHDFPLK